MRNLLLISTLLLISCHSTLPAWKQDVMAELPERERYFCEIALGSEFGRKYHKIRKWQQPVNVFLTGTEVPQLERELDKIIDELNEISPAINIARVFEATEANLYIFLGKGADFAQRYPVAKKQVEQNWGLVFIKQNGKGEIQNSHVYIDVFRATDLTAQKHLLREELTQALGLLNDSQQFPDSIFYQEWTLTTTYTELDKWLIKILYNEEMEVGMKLKEVMQFLK